MPRWSKEPKNKIRTGRGWLRKHAESRVWYFHYRGPDHRWKSETTGHVDKDGALEWAMGRSLELTRIEQGIIKAEEKVSNDAIDTAAEEWLKYVGSQRSAGTLRTYQSCINNLEAYLQTRPRVRRLDQFTESEVLRYREWLLKRGDGKKTVDNNLVCLRSFFNYCVGLHKIRACPIREQRRGVQVFFNERRPLIETYTRAEYALIIKHAPKELARRIRFLGASGLRIDELAHLECSDVDLKRGWLHVRTKVTHDGIPWQPKDKTDRKLPLNHELQAVLAELEPRSRDADRPTPNQYLFDGGKPGKWRAKNLARQTLNALKTLSKPTGIPKSKLTSHNFRRYFVSQCADCGIDILCVMEWVGHDDWEMVRRYYRLRDEHAKAAMGWFTTGVPMVRQSAEGHAAPPDAPDRPLGGPMGNEGSQMESAGESDETQSKPAA
jgi:integrase